MGLRGNRSRPPPKQIINLKRQGLGKDITNGVYYGTRSKYTSHVLVHDRAYAHEVLILTLPVLRTNRYARMLFALPCDH